MFRFALCFAAALGLFGSSTHAQTPRFKSEVEAVLVDVSVQFVGEPVSGLTEGHFILRDNGIEQQATLLSQENTPVDVILLLDKSSSVYGRKLQALRQAVKTFLAGLREEDRAALITFHHFVTIDQKLTLRREPLYRALDETEARGGTALYDALRRGARLTHPPANRTILLLFTDGEDTLSGTTEEEVFDSVKQSNAVVYVVASVTTVEEEARKSRKLEISPGYITTRSPDLEQSQAELERRIRERTRFVRELANWTGGRIWDVEDSAQIESAFQAILNEIANRYVLAYHPKGVDVGGWHEIDVQLAGHVGEVRARRGYFHGPVKSR